MCLSKRYNCLTSIPSNVSKMTKLSEVVSTLKSMAPLSLAESWDNVGLLMEPDLQKPISCVFLTNDLTEDVLEEAESVNADLIVSYHPPVFAPFKRITSEAWKVLLLVLVTLPKLNSKERKPEPRLHRGLHEPHYKKIILLEKKPWWFFFNKELKLELGQTLHFFCWTVHNTFS